MKISERLVGVGGWLRFLIIVLFIGGGFSIFNAVAALSWKEVEKQNPSLSAHIAFQNFQMTDRGIQLLVGMLLIYCGYILYSQMISQTLKAAKLIIGLAYPLSIVVRNVISPYFFLGMSPTQDMVTEIVQAIIWAVIWTSYLSRSERVKNTYHNTL